MAALRRRRRQWRPRRDWGRVLAGVLCAVFGLVGAVPLGLGFLVRTGPVRAWAANETSALIAKTLGVKARYEVVVQAWPMMVALERVVVDASDGGGPFLTAERVAVRPRPFSLLAGRFDAGDVEIVGPRVRAVVEGGQVKNLSYHLPEGGKTGGDGSPPVASLSITDARIDASVDGMHVGARALDADISAEDEGAYEIALRAGETTVTRLRAFPGRPDEDAVDDDVICRAEARVRVQGRRVLVRRLSAQGSADFDPDPGTRPSCALEKGDWRGFDVRLGAVRVDLPGYDGGRPPMPPGPAGPIDQPEPLRVAGRVHARLPLPLVHRVKDIAHVTGSATADLEIDYGGAAQLARVEGHIAADQPGIDGKVFGARIDLDVAVGSGKVGVTNLVAHWADGVVTIPSVTIKPFEDGVPIETSPIAIEGIEMTGLLRDLGAHPQAHVAWTLEKGRFETLKGFLDPPFIEGPLTVQTRGFEIFDRPAVDPFRAHMMGVKEGTVRCTFVVNERMQSRYKYRGVVISNASIDTPKSHMLATVTLGTHTTRENPHNIIDIDVAEGSRVDLSEISPLGDIPVSGVLSLRASGRGAFEHPILGGDMKISDFVFADLPVGNVEAPRFAFEPLVLQLFDTHVRHGQSRVRSDHVRLVFADGATVVADADVDTTEAPGLKMKDALEVFHFDKDPRFAGIDGGARGKGRVRYVLGGKEDRCGGGVLDVQASMGLEDVSILGERFDGGSIDAGVHWDDQPSGTAGLLLDLRSAILRKGEGSILVGATVRHGGFVQGHAVAGAVPLARIDALSSQLDALGAAGKHVEGTASVVAEIGGTLSSLTLGADVNVSRVRIGPASLGPSHLHVGMSASPPPPPPREMPACHNGKAEPFKQAEYDQDLSGGDVTVDGALFDGQLQLDGLTLSRQRSKVIERGRVTARALDLGTIANLVPGVAFSDTAFSGALSATLDVAHMPLAAPRYGKASLVLESLHLARGGLSADLLEKTKPIELAGDRLTAEVFKLRLRSGSGSSATIALGGSASHVTTAPTLDVHLGLEPVDLARLGADIPSVERAAGTLTAEVGIAGPVSAPRFVGAVTLHKGELQLKGFPVGLSEAEVAIAIADGDAQLTKAEARVGGGTLRVTGRMPLRGPEAGAFLANVEARGVKVPVQDGVSLTADAKLEAVYRPALLGQQRSLPDVKGTVELTQFSYTRPMGLNLALSQLGRPSRTNVETYDPENDIVHFNVNLVSPRPLRVANNLVECDVEIASPGLVLSGTNQRFGARGLLRILPDSKLQFRSNEFVVKEGQVRFDDPMKIAPIFDVRAQTEYRRYASSAEPAAAGAVSTGDASGTSGAAASPVSAAASTSAAGVWRITLQARGETDNLKVALSSDPPLSQEDIVLLLTLGMTRAELDRGATAAFGQGLGLEALSALTGADKAVKTVVPLIDDFRFGTGYSSKTASPEPTVTVGKRITENVRATVTTGLSEDREVRSNVEVRLNRNLSVQGSYDNLTDVSSSPVGNLGVDLRWRLEFE